jgi:hypothetical protein
MSMRRWFLKTLGCLAEEKNIYHNFPHRYRSIFSRYTQNLQMYMSYVLLILKK